MLTDKQQAFVVEYCKCWNASEAARRAGYSAKTAASIGAENLTKPDIAAEIDAFKAAHMMSAEETQIALTEQARGDMGDFLAQDGDMVTIDLPKAVAAKKTGLIKKLNQSRTTRTYGNGDVEVTVNTSIELYDKQAALIQIGKIHKLFTERSELSAPDGGPIRTKGEAVIEHRIDGGSAATIFDILAGIGAIQPPSDDAAPKSLHSPAS